MYATHRMKILTAAALSSGALACAAAPTYSITALAEGSCIGLSINDQSVVSGTCDNTATIWKKGVATTVGRLPGGNYSEANAANSSGIVVGDGDTGNNRPQGWVLLPSGLVNFFPNNGGNTHALFVGDNGFIGGYYTKSLSGNTSSWKGSIWTPDPKSPGRYRQRDLPTLAGGIDPKFTSSIPFAFNQSGQAAGYATNDVIGQHAAFWNSDAARTVVDLGTLPGDWSSIASAINDLGEVVGESHPPFSSIPALWSNDAAHTASALPFLAGDNYGSADGINNAGHVLGWSTYMVPGTWDVAGPTHVVLWRDGAVHDIHAVLEPLTGAGWNITYAAGLNNLGQIVGLGTLNGVLKTFVMTPQ